MKQKYYAVTTKCGHVRKSRYVEVTFAIAAESGKEAAKIGRFMPRVKHDHPMAIVNVVKISYEEYLELKENNSNDLYLQCSSRQEQNRLCPDIYSKVKELYEDDNDEYENKEKRKQRLEFLFKKRKVFGGDLDIRNNFRLA